MTTAEFQSEFLSHASLPKADDPREIVADFVAKRSKALATAEKLGVGDEGTRNVRMKFAKAFVRRWMMRRFAALDLSFTERKWWLKIERTEPDGATIVADYDSEPAAEVDRVMILIAEIDRFFHAETDAINFAFKDVELRKERQYVGSFAHGKRDGVHYRNRDVMISAKLPDGLTDKHTKLVRQALSHYHLARALCYAEGVDLRDDLRETNYHEKTAPLLQLIWAPNRDCLSVQTRAPRPMGDPAVIFAVGGHSFLLDFYDTPDEQPIEHLIREFSEGSLAK